MPETMKGSSTDSIAVSQPAGAAASCFRTLELRQPGGRRPVVIQGDDLGLLYAFNEGIRRAYQDGCLTSTALRANGYAYGHALGDVLPACPELSVGLHLCLNEGRPVSLRHRVPLLLASDGDFRPGFRWLIGVSRSVTGMRQIEREFRAQIEKVLADGVRIDHLNSHQHVHLIPRLFELACRLAIEYDIRSIRLVREPAYVAPGLARRIGPLVNANYIKHLLLNHFASVNEQTVSEYGLATTRHFIGVMYTGHMDCRTIDSGIKAAGPGSVEVLLHPAIGPDPRDRDHTSRSNRRYIAAPGRSVEVQTLTSPELPRILRRHNAVATSFADFAKTRPEQVRFPFERPAGLDIDDEPRPGTVRSRRLPKDDERVDFNYPLVEV